MDSDRNKWRSSLKKENTPECSRSESWDNSPAQNPCAIKVITLFGSFTKPFSVLYLCLLHVALMGKISVFLPNYFSHINLDPLCALTFLYVKGDRNLDSSGHS